MEMEGFKKCLNRLFQWKLEITAFISDRHIQFRAHMRDTYDTLRKNTKNPHIQHFLDIWHVAKSKSAMPCIFWFDIFVKWFCEVPLCASSLPYVRHWFYYVFLNFYLFISLSWNNMVRNKLHIWDFWPKCLVPSMHLNFVEVKIIILVDSRYPDISTIHRLRTLIVSDEALCTSSVVTFSRRIGCTKSRSWSTLRNTDQCILESVLKCWEKKLL